MQHEKTGSTICLFSSFDEETAVRKQACQLRPNYVCPIVDDEDDVGDNCLRKNI